MNYDETGDDELDLAKKVIKQVFVTILVRWKHLTGTNFNDLRVFSHTGKVAPKKI